jgi:hypothetical protein
LDCSKKPSSWFCCERLYDYVCIWPNFVICVKSVYCLGYCSVSPFWTCHSFIRWIVVIPHLSRNYSSAISVSEDVIIRQTVRKSVTRESELLGSIGSSHMEQELERRVLMIREYFRFNGGADRSRTIYH